MSESYTVEEHEHGLLVRGPVPVAHLPELGARALDKGWDQWDAGLAMALTDPGGARVSLVYVSKTSREAWRNEVNDAAAEAYPNDNVMAWLHSTGMGTSSLVMVSRLGTPEQRALAMARLGDFEERTHPRDVADLGRCLGLLRAAPAWRDRLGELSGLSRSWAALVGVWGELQVLDEARDFAGVNQRMGEVLRV